MEGFELQPDETITLFVRRHWALLAMRLLPDIFLVLLPLIFIYAYTGAAPTPPERFIIGLWWLLVWTSGFSQVTRYYLNVWVITTSRIIDIRQPRFFVRNISSFLLDRVQDVTTNVQGFAATAIGFGTLTVETAGQNAKFLMTGVPDPSDIRDLIMREVDNLHSTAPSSSPHTDGL